VPIDRNFGAGQVVSRDAVGRLHYTAKFSGTLNGGTIISKKWKQKAANFWANVKVGMGKGIHRFRAGSWNRARTKLRNDIDLVLNDPRLDIPNSPIAKRLRLELAHEINSRVQSAFGRKIAVMDTHNTHGVLPKTFRNYDNQGSDVASRIFSLEGVGPESTVNKFWKAVKQEFVTERDTYPNTSSQGSSAPSGSAG
jgi:hypothetical protein